MGSNESKAKVIDVSNEYKNGINTSFDNNSSSPQPSSLSSPSKKSSVDKCGGNEMAKGINTAKNVFSLVADVLEKEGDKANQNIMKLFKMLKRAKFFCEGAGIVLNLVVDDAVVAQLNKIHKEIREVRNDIKELERTMKWETTRIQYADICTVIVTGMEFCKQIQSNAANDSLKHDYQERLKELCSNQRFTLAMNTLLDGITGKGDFRIDILHLIYHQTKGSRPDVMRMAGRLLQLLTGGLTTLLTYETLVRGRQSAEQLEQAMYADCVKEAEQCYMNVVQRCEDESKENMAKDIDRICEGKTVYKDLPKDICDELARKYDWLQFQCVAYKDASFVRCHGSRIEKGCSSGDVVCFYTSKHATLNTFSSSEKSRMDEIISKSHSGIFGAIRGRLATSINTKPDGYDPLMAFMNQTSDQRQCWIVGSSLVPEQIMICNGQEIPECSLEIYHGVSDGLYQHLIKKCEITRKYCFVSMFFQDSDSNCVCEKLNQGN